MLHTPLPPSVKRKMNNLLQKKDKNKKPTPKSAHLQTSRADTPSKFAKELFSSNAHFILNNLR